MITVRPTIALLCAAALATCVAACGATTSVSTSAFKGEQQQVAQAVAHLQSHATALEAKKICGEDLAAARVAQLNAAPGRCKQAIESQLKQIDSFETTVASVTIAPAGATATARVKSVVGGKKAVQTVTLVREGGKWRISGLVGFAVIPKAGTTGKS
jgi:copper chaperone CopZ